MKPWAPRCEQCDDKRLYRSRYEAIAAALRRSNETATPHRVYRCPHRKLGFHLTTKAKHGWNETAEAQR